MTLSGGSLRRRDFPVIIVSGAGGGGHAPQKGILGLAATRLTVSAEIQGDLASVFAYLQGGQANGVESRPVVRGSSAYHASGYAMSV